jgi:hypothetical protein
MPYTIYILPYTLFYLKRPTNTLLRMLLNTSVCWAYVSIRQHTSASVSIHLTNATCEHQQPLTYAHGCSRMLTDAHGCSRMLMYAHVCSRMLTHADACWRMLTGTHHTYADVCWRMLTDAHTCSHMLTGTLACTSSAACLAENEEVFFLTLSDPPLYMFLLQLKASDTSSLRPQTLVA